MTEDEFTPPGLRPRYWTSLTGVRHTWGGGALLTVYSGASASSLEFSWYEKEGFAANKTNDLPVIHRGGALFTVYSGAKASSLEEAASCASRFVFVWWLTAIHLRCIAAHIDQCSSHRSSRRSRARLQVCPSRGQTNKNHQSSKTHTVIMRPAF